MSSTLEPLAQARALEAGRAAALLAGDCAGLQALLSPGLVYVHSSGLRDTRASLLARLGSGQLRYQDLSLDDLQCQAHPDVLIVTGRMRAGVLKAAQALHVDSLFMTVWLCTPQTPQTPHPPHAPEAASWQLVAHHGLPTPR